MSREEKTAAVTAIAACLLLSHALIYGAGYMHGAGDIIGIHTKAERQADAAKPVDNHAGLPIGRVPTRTETASQRRHREGKEAAARLAMMARAPKAVSPPDRYLLQWVPKGMQLAAGQPGIEMHPGIYVPPAGVSYLGIGVAPSPDYKAVFVKQ